MFLHLIADYGKNDLAFNEVIHRLKGFRPDLDVFPLSVPSFSTLATGFAIAQLSEYPAKGGAIYANTAPRKDDKKKREKNDGEGLVFAKLRNGNIIIGVNSGYCFSFVRDQLAELRHIKISNNGSQFRSRDNYPEVVIRLMEGETGYLGAELDPQLIPNIPQNQVAWVDGYGNIKTTIRRSTVDFKNGELIQILLNGARRTAWFADGTFEVHEGDLAFAPGSSGGEDRFLEIFLRGGNARKSFYKARVGQEIVFKRF